MVIPTQRCHIWSYLLRDAIHGHTYSEMPYMVIHTQKCQTIHTIVQVWFAQSPYTDMIDKDTQKSLHWMFPVPLLPLAVGGAGVKKYMQATKDVPLRTHPLPQHPFQSTCCGQL